MSSNTTANELGNELSNKSIDDPTKEPSNDPINNPIKKLSKSELAAEIKKWFDEACVPFADCTASYVLFAYERFEIDTWRASFDDFYKNLTGENPPANMFNIEVAKRCKPPIKNRRRPDRWDEDSFDNDDRWDDDNEY